MERQVGEIFEYNGEWYQCMEGTGCYRCAFYDKNICIADNPHCTCRSDKKNVIFKKLEKVGEPYEYFIQGMGIIIVQEYILANASYIYDDNRHVVMMDCQNGRIAIEIKQNKEDMEGRELDPHMAKVIDEATQKMGEEIGRQIRENINKQRMKPFSLEAAKAGKPVCTRDGAKARIICFDAKSDAPIIALITTDDGTEIAFDYLSDGTFFNSENPDNDLMMLPEKKEGWVNIYKEGVDQYIYNNEKAASSRRGSDCIATIKIEWEE